MESNESHRGKNKQKRTSRSLTEELKMSKLKTMILLMSALTTVMCTVGCGTSTDSTSTNSNSSASSTESEIEPVGTANDEVETQPAGEVTASTSENDETTTEIAEATLNADQQKLLDEAAKAREEMEKNLERWQQNEGGNSTAPETAPDLNVEGETTRVGEANYGYVDVPSTWVRFKDVDATGNLFQYSDTTGKSIVTLSYYDVDGLDAHQAAQNFSAGLFEQDDIESDSIQGAKVKLGKDKVDCYQVYCFYPADKQFLVAHFFDGDDGYVHYLAIEGTESETFELANTYSLTK